MPNKRVYSITIFWTFPPPYWFIWLYLFSFFHLSQLPNFSLYSFIWFYILYYEIYVLKNPPYSFIWSYSFNWHLRVDYVHLGKKGEQTALSYHILKFILGQIFFLQNLNTMQRKDRQIIDTIVHRATAIPDKCIAI